MLQRISQILQRLAEYNFWEVGVEFVILWAAVYIVYRFVRGTRAAGALKGLVLILIVGTLGVRVLGDRFFPRLAVLYNNFLGFAAIALVVTFQPELRRALIRLGETSWLRRPEPEIKPVVEAIAASAELLSKSKFGALIALERNVGLREVMEESGKFLNADVSAPLLNSIFWPNNPLHDMGVVISGRKIIAAGVQFPLAEPGDMPDSRLGTRHRAAVGLARVSDALVVVVSEETGVISLADGRELSRYLTPAALAHELMTRLTRVPQQQPGEPRLEATPMEIAGAGTLERRKSARTRSKGAGHA